jgi:glycosyltransferase involved in cell wall biosynthesis
MRAFLPISVVIPVYNEEKFIGPCLDALQRQTVQPHSIIIVNNNSTDATLEIIEKYPGITIVHQPIQGICASVKLGLDVAAEKGGIIVHCDADCIPASDWIEKVLHTFKTTEAIAVTGPGVAYDVGPVRRWLIDTFYMKAYFFFVGLALKQIPLFGSNYSIKADTWKQMSETTHLLSHQDIHDDIDLTYHLLEKGVIHYDATLKMPMSARPFKNVTKLPDRYAIGFRSIFMHWPQQAPWNIKKERYER